jgi:hypothetical protein
MLNLYVVLHQMIITNVIADDKPAVVVTHGDRLSFEQRSHVQNALAETLDIPIQQIFDIPGIGYLLSIMFLLYIANNTLHLIYILYTGSDDYRTDMAVLDMLRYCIQCAEQNFPLKLNYLLEV